MIRAGIVLATAFLCAACSGDGRGSQYSSARAQVSAPAYIPVTPGARPVATPTATGNNATAPRLSGPVAITPGATPILASSEPRSALAPTTSLRPRIGPGRGSRVAKSNQKRARQQTATGRKFAKGPIYSACRSAGRKEATQSRCGCVQWVADRELTAAQQKRGAGYFNNQHGLQEARQSDNAANERFWKAWKAFGQQASQQCRRS